MEDYCTKVDSLTSFPPYQIFQFIGYLGHRLSTYLNIGSIHILLCISLAGHLDPNCTIFKTSVILYGPFFNNISVVDSIIICM